jgi:signal peptidase
LQALTRALVTVSVTLVVLALGAHYFLGVRLHVVLSDSMRPTFKSGDLLVTRSVPTAGLGVGDVPVLLRADVDGPVAHRIIEVEHTGTTTLVTKGDANSSSDPALVLAASEVPAVVTSLPVPARLLLVDPRVRAGLVLAAGLVTIASLVQMHRRSRKTPCTCQAGAHADEPELEKTR